MNPNLIRRLPALTLFISLIACANTSSHITIENSASTRRFLHCDVVIVGGGIAGLHTAYRLGERGKESVCLFEKQPSLGGRILDQSLDTGPESPRMGIGARRFHEHQTLSALAREFKIEPQESPLTGEFISARGQHAFSKDDLASKAYPYLKTRDQDKENDDDVETTLIVELRKRNHIEKFPDFPSYVRATVGAEGYQYLIDMARFRGDWQYPIDSKSYLDWLEQEDELGKLYYPVGGMSEFIRRMAVAAENKGVRIFTSEPVSVLQRRGNRYEALTPRYRAAANSVVIAVNAASLVSIHGDIADSITNSAQYQDLIGVKVVTITQWWPKAWWTGLPVDKKGRPVRRVITTEHCIGFMEIPVDDYGAHQLVTRTVYNDERVCVAVWEQLAKVSNSAVDEEIERGLHYLFPEVTIPIALKTHVQIWPDAWYWLKAGSKFTNCDIAEWALHPIDGEAISLVGDSYNPQRATWSDAAIKSSIATLSTNFEFKTGSEVPVGKSCQTTKQR